MSEEISAQSDSSKSIAVNAIQTVPALTDSAISEFLTFLKENQFTPIARIQQLPVYRLSDYEANQRCYLSNERSQPDQECFVRVAFSMADDYLAFTGSSLRSDKVCESYLVSTEIINIAVLRVNGEELTPAELRVTAQILTGLSIKSAAELDHVSLETKRSQTKAIISKLKVSRQQDVIRIILPELVGLVNPDSWDTNKSHTFNHYVNNFLPGDVRCQRLSDVNNRSVRIIDYGPLRGRPVMILHSMIFPDITIDDIQFANEHNLRLIWPLRPGLLEVNALPKSASHYSTETLEGIDLAWEHMCGEPVSIIAMVSSAWHAVAFAKEHPNKVKDISFAATCFSAGKYENSLIYFGSSVAELCSRNLWLMTKTIDFIRNHANDLEIFKSTIFRAFRDSKPDIEVLEKEFSAPNGGTRIKSALVDSAESVKHDYFNQVHFQWSTIAAVKAPVKFVHGAQDSFHKLKDVKKLINQIGNCPLLTFESTGHIMQYSHFQQLLTSSLNLADSADYRKSN